MGLGPGEGLPRGQRERPLAAHEAGQAARPEDDPERRPGEAQPRVGRPDPVVAGGDQVGTGADGRALDDRHRGERCLEQPLQQQPDPQEAVRQPRVVLVVEAVEVEPAAEVPAPPPEDEHAGPLRDRSVEPGVQALDQVGRQRVGAVRPVELEDEGGHAAPQSAQHLVGVRAQHRSGAVEPARDPADAGRVDDGRGQPGHRHLLLLHQPGRGDVVVGQHLAVRVHRAARDPAGAQLAEPVRRPSAAELRLQDAGQHGLVRHPVALGAEPGVVDELRQAGHLGHGRPQPVVAGGDGEVAVLRPEGLVRRVARVGGAEPAGLLAGPPVLAGLQGGGGDQAVEHRAVDAHLPALADRRQQRGDGQRGVQAGGEVTERHARLDRAAEALAGHRHHAAHALDHHVVGAVVDVGARQAVAGDRAVDEPPVTVAGDLVVAQPEPVEHARPVVLHHHVGLGDERPRAGEIPPGP